MSSKVCLRAKAVGYADSIQYSLPLGEAETFEVEARSMWLQLAPPNPLSAHYFYSLNHVAIDMTAINSLSFIIKKGGEPNASLLCEVPRQERNEGC